MRHIKKMNENINVNDDVIAMREKLRKLDDVDYIDLYNLYYLKDIKDEKHQIYYNNAWYFDKKYPDIYIMDLIKLIEKSVIHDSYHSNDKYVTMTDYGYLLTDNHANELCYDSFEFAEYCVKNKKRLGL